MVFEVGLNKKTHINRPLDESSQYESENCGGFLKSDYENETTGVHEVGYDTV